MTQVLDREIVDGRVVLNGTWEQFKLIQKVSEASPGIKLSFFAGAIEILMPGFQHENFSEIIGYQKLGLKPRPYRTTLISPRCEDWLNIHTLIVQILAHKV